MRYREFLSFKEKLIVYIGQEVMENYNWSRRVGEFSWVKEIDFSHWLRRYEELSLVKNEEIKKHHWPIGNREFSWASAFFSQR